MSAARAVSRARRRRRIARLPALALLAVLGLVVAGCADAPAAQSSAVEKPHLVVGALPIVDAAPMHLALERGFFRDVGLDVTIAPEASSDVAIQGLNDGSFDISGAGNYPTVLSAYARGEIDPRIIAEGALASPGLDQVMVSPRSGIRDAAGLAGRTIAVNSPPPNIQTITLNRVLAARGVDPASVRYVFVPFTGAVDALRSGAVDAAWLVEPFVTEAGEQAGALPVVDPCSGPTDAFPLDAYFVTARFAQQYPKTIQAFRTALARASALAADDQATTSILPTYSPVDPATASLITLPTYVTSLRVERVQRVADLMAQSGVIDRRLDMSTLVVP